MTPLEIKAVLNEIHIEVGKIRNADEKAVIIKLLNLVETLVSENEQYIKEIQQLKDEINRLKGEQGKPKFTGKKPKDGDVSSEDERNTAEGKGKKGKNSKRNRRPKIPDIKIDREKVCRVNQEELPDDVVFKGYEEVVVQDIIIITDNVKYLREVYYSPSQKKTWLGALPKEVEGQGELGPGIRTLIPLMKSECNMSEPKILAFFRNFDIQISPAYISSCWTGKQDVFHGEKDAIYRAGLESGNYQQIDDTGGKVNGVNHYVQILCNDNYTAYFTTERKDRLTVLDVFRNFAPRRFTYNDEALDLLKTFGLSGKIINAVNSRPECRRARDTFWDIRVAKMTALGDSLLARVRPAPGPRLRHCAPAPRSLRRMA